MKRGIAQAAKKFPLTVAGCLTLGIALFVLVCALAVRNTYEVILSLAALSLLTALYIKGRWSLKRFAAVEPLWKIPIPLTAHSNEDWIVTTQAEGVPIFFRLHAVLRGRFSPQGSGERESCRTFIEISLPRTGGSSNVRVSFPLGGTLDAETSCRLHDIFGFFSFHGSVVRELHVKLRSSPCASKPLLIEAHSGAEDRRNKSATDEERYYMREYAPGDRFRDINWKSSERINTLITRISPDNQEKVTRIEVHLRNYGAPRGIADLWLLDRLKARLAWFLRKAKEDKASYVFEVRSALGNWDLTDDEDIEAFLDDLAALPFCPAANEEAPPARSSEIYVFSTACDTSLPAFLLMRQGQPISLFMAAHNRKGSQPHASSIDRLYLKDFLTLGTLPHLRWLKPKRQGSSASGASLVSSSRTMIDYAEVSW